MHAEDQLSREQYRIQAYTLGSSVGAALALQAVEFVLPDTFVETEAACLRSRIQLEKLDVLVDNIEGSDKCAGGFFLAVRCHRGILYEWLQFPLFEELIFHLLE